MHLDDVERRSSHAGSVTEEERRARWMVFRWNYIIELEAKISLNFQGAEQGKKMRRRLERLMDMR